LTPKPNGQARKVATMTDVAKRAGVAISTVSAVLNDTAFVSPELKDRVLAAANEYGYRINALARGLKHGSSQTVGMLIPDFAAPDPFFSEVVQGAEIALRAKDYSLLLGQTHDQVTEQSRHIAKFRARLIDGLLLFQCQGKDPELDALIAERKPVVFVGRVPFAIQADVVATDIEAGTYMGVSHLLAKGRRRVALITNRDSLSVREFRLKGWHRAHAEYGATADSRLHVDTPRIAVDAGHQATEHLLTQPDPPDAIFANDLVTSIGAVRALQRQGLLSKIEVFSSDDAEWLDVFHIPISTIVQPSHEVGSIAGRLFLDRIREPERSFETVLLKPTLKVR
jgi:LacI family transcriptional regulator